MGSEKNHFLLKFDVQCLNCSLACCLIHKFYKMVYSLTERIDSILFKKREDNGMMLRLPSLAVFDLAGTTIRDDGTVVSVFQEVLAAEAIRPTPEEIARVRGAAKREAFRRLVGEGVQADRLYQRFIGGIRQRYAAAPPVEFQGLRIPLSGYAGKA